MARRKATRSVLSSIGSLPLLGAGGVALWMLYQSLQVRGGKEWRGYTGTVVLQPGLVYRIEMLAPRSGAGANLGQRDFQEAIEEQLVPGGARNFLWSIVPGGINEGVHLYFDQSWQEPTTLTFGKGGVGPLVPHTARRLDGLDWDAP